MDRSVAPENTSTPIDRPDSLASAPQYLVEGFDKQDADTLRELAGYAQRLAEWWAAQAAVELAEQATDIEGVPDGWADAVDDAREKADLPSGEGTLTVKQIDGRDYYSSGGRGPKSKAST